MARLKLTESDTLNADIERLWCIGSTRKIAALLGVDRSCVIRRAKKLGLNPSKHFWKPNEDAILRELYPNTLSADIAKVVGVPVGSVHDRAERLGLRKDKEWLRENSREVQRRTGNPGRFRKGLTPWNKGKRCPGLGGATSFKPGNRPHTWKPIGTERISKDGYLQRKVTDSGPARHHYKSVHVMVWESANGPVPAGHAVLVKDGNKQNLALANLELVSRAELMRRNTIHRLPEDIKSACYSLGKLRRVINKLEKRT